MKKCYEFYILRVDTQYADGKKDPSWEFSSIDPDTSGEIIDFLQKHNRDSDQFFYNVDAMYKQYGVWPWAIVLFDEEFRLAGHVASIRKDKKDLLFSAYSINTGNYSVAEMGVPSVSHLYVYRKEAIEEAAIQSELFKAAWERLRDLPEHRHWICIADSPSEGWVKQTSQNDDQLFMKVSGF